MKRGYVYMMTNKNNNVLYTGVTSNLSKRIWQHKEKAVKGFTSKYNIDKLVYYEACENMMGAIEREKQIKGGSRAKKEKLIKMINPFWKDLSDTVY